MKNYLFLLLISIGTLGFGQSQEKELEALVQNFFEEVFSNLNVEKLDDYVTPDFMLFEDGEIWEKPKVASVVQQLKDQFNSEENKKNTFKRINSFKFIRSKIDGNTAWVYYENFADFTMNGASISKMHWLESVNFTKTPQGWKMSFMHSTIVKEK